MPDMAQAYAGKNFVPLSDADGAKLLDENRKLRDDLSVASDTIREMETELKEAESWAHGQMHELQRLPKLEEELKALQKKVDEADKHAVQEHEAKTEHVEDKKNTDEIAHLRAKIAEAEARAAEGSKGAKELEVLRKENEKLKTTIEDNQKEINMASEWARSHLKELENAEARAKRAEQAAKDAQKEKEQAVAAVEEEAFRKKKDEDSEKSARKKAALEASALESFKREMKEKESSWEKKLAALKPELDEAERKWKEAQSEAERATAGMSRLQAEIEEFRKRAAEFGAKDEEAKARQAATEQAAETAKSELTRVKLELSKTHKALSKALEQANKQEEAVEPAAPAKKQPSTEPGKKQQQAAAEATKKKKQEIAVHSPGAGAEAQAPGVPTKLEPSAEPSTALKEPNGKVTNENCKETAAPTKPVPERLPKNELQSTAAGKTQHPAKKFGSKSSQYSSKDGGASNASSRGSRESLLCQVQKRLGYKFSAPDLIIFGVLLYIVYFLKTMFF